MVFFEAPHRTAAALAAMADAFGDDRAAAVCRELTKTHEEVRRGPLAELVAWAADGVRGEVTIVVEGSAGAPAVDTDPGSLRSAVAALEDSGSTRKEAIAEVAKRAGLPKREVYDVVLAAQLAAIKAVKPGARISQIDSAARSVITKAGFGDYFIHGIGHHLGLDTHDSAPAGDQPLKAGAVVTIEPGVYIPSEKIGIRIEDDVLVTASGLKVLSEQIPKSAEQIEKIMRPK